MTYIWTTYNFTDNCETHRKRELYFGNATKAREDTGERSVLKWQEWILC